MAREQESGRHLEFRPSDQAVLEFLDALAEFIVDSILEDRANEPLPASEQPC